MDAPMNLGGHTVPDGTVGILQAAMMVVAGCHYVGFCWSNAHWVPLELVRWRWVVFFVEPFILPLWLLDRWWARQSKDAILGVEIVRWCSKQLMGPNLGTIKWRLLEGSEEVVDVMDYRHWKSPSSLWSCMQIPHSILLNHTEGHSLNGCDSFSRKAG